MEFRSKKCLVPLQCHGRSGVQKLESSHDGQSAALDKYLNISYLLFSTRKQHNVEEDLLPVGQAAARRPVLGPEFLPLYPIFTSCKLRMTAFNTL